MACDLVGVAGFEPAASSSRSQRAMWPTTILTPSDLPHTVRGSPLAFAIIVAVVTQFVTHLLTRQGPSSVVTGLIPPAKDRLTIALSAIAEHGDAAKLPRSIVAKH